MGIEGYYEDYFDNREEPKKLTNYEKIRNMTLDEMAEFYMVLLNKMLKKIKKDLDKEQPK